MPNQTSEKFNQNVSASKTFDNQASDEYANMGNNLYPNAKTVPQPNTNNLRPAGESSSDGGPTFEEIKGEDQSHSSQGSIPKKSGETGSSLQNR